MRRYYIEQKLKSAAAFLIILILLPYIVSVFVNGTGAGTEGEEEISFVQVKTTDSSGEEEIREIGWTRVSRGHPCRRTAAGNRGGGGKGAGRTGPDRTLPGNWQVRMMFWILTI